MLEGWQNAPWSSSDYLWAVASDRLATWSGLVLLADPSSPDHRERGKGWWETEKKQTWEGGREGDDCSEGKKWRYGGTPLAGSEMISADSVTHPHLSASLSAGTPCCHSTSRCPENPDRDDYRFDKEVGITPLAVGKKTVMRSERGKNDWSSKAGMVGPQLTSRTA